MIDYGSKLVFSHFPALHIIALLLLPSSSFAGGAPPLVDPITDKSITPDIADHGDSPKTLESKLQFTIQASDPENDPLFFRIASFAKNSQPAEPPSDITLDDASGDFHWPVRPHQVGTYTITFEVKDCRPAEGQNNCSGGSTYRAVQIDVSKGPICDESGSACDFLAAREESGAAGSVGDFYLCGDYDGTLSYHSVINVAGLPQLDFLDKIGQSEFTLNPGYNSRGYEGRVFAGKVVIGNSSTAYTSGTNWGGHVRKNCMPGQSAVNTGYSQYTGNTHMWYPEHRDHDDIDHHFCQIPYCSASQGSSGSERDELEKFMRTLASFKTPVKDRLRDAGLLIPILQMVFRRSRVSSDEEYLSGPAHPNAFDNSSNRDAMMQLAFSIDEDNIPPLAEVEILDHSYSGVPGKDFFSAAEEKYFATPASSAFIFRGKAYTKYIIASARDSYDLNNRALSYHWAVLRGSPDHVRITPLAQNKSVVRIEIDYHQQTTIEGTTRLTNLVSVGAFVHNGAYYSSPAFITSYSLHNESRTYSDGRIQEIRYVDNYVDPNISSSKIPWDRDVFHYSGSSLNGWTRHLTGGETQEFNADGHCTSCTGYSASGTVAFNGQGLAGVTVRARRTSTDEGPYYAQTDSSGSFSFPKIREGSYYFEVETPPSRYRVSSAFGNISGSAQSGINPNVSCAAGFQQLGDECTPLYTIGGQVRLGGGGIEGVEIIVQAQSGAEYTTFTSSDGSYLIGVPTGGSYFVNAKSLDFILTPNAWSNPVTLSGSPAHADADFTAGCQEWAADARCSDPGDRIPRAPRNLRAY